MESEEKVEAIEHEGTVVKVDAAARKITVSLDDRGECGQCAAAALCGVESGKSNLVEVSVDDPSLFKPGYGVRLEGTERLHRKAIMLATVIPSVLLIGVMTLIFFLTGNQLLACLGGIGAMALFFVVLWLIRDRLRHEFVFEITEVDHGGD